MEEIEPVLNFALLLLSLAFGLVEMYVSRPDAQTMIFWLLFCNPGAKPDVAD